MDTANANENIDAGKNSNIQNMDIAEEAQINLNLKNKTPKLPISKIKKIAKTDPEYMTTSNLAYIATAITTELFIQSFTERTLSLNQIRTKSKNKRLVYEDLAECVVKYEEFQFLGDVVPRTKNLKSLVKENKVRYTTQQVEEIDD
ncbi:hypothetical protein TBLA_0F01380 [Henningerozyma blattae CBS 6284]|uniref:Transcription factor CBF/NF-Y/archaeal histone domain-containing protein n=1 Tax=Henningerozyma blattae (strain ATCC 34711 / CBS 6284 / DSM 70876 / NBRC 10599 / NRRL Y-10934 / UCD 77-7) TaxID=1071380 RepID=I2H5M9_HENB6|nr:hypothetical protein TBLA_0F01380 [Tetrapisispora blattae CBS 6284]CCH61681.1 hypothetical protein TBLA_0F01380 [Tetrapisispora blattae CBS 6284]